MSVRVVARIRPLLKQEIEKDIIVRADSIDSSTTVRIPNPKNDAELYTFQFNSVYGQNAIQQEIFDGEGNSPRTTNRLQFLRLYSRADSETSV
jgi:hypothetical protein